MVALAAATMTSLVQQELLEALWVAWPRIACESLAECVAGVSRWVPIGSNPNTTTQSFGHLEGSVRIHPIGSNAGAQIPLSELVFSGRSFPQLQYLHNEVWHVDFAAFG